MLTHIDKENRGTMVDIGDKVASQRQACAQSLMKAPSALLERFHGGDLHVKKGAVFATAIVAGTMAVKRCWDLIPFCHPLPIDGCHFSIEIVENQMIQIKCWVKTFHKTGVEMEALTGASIAALTVYDMCKALAPEMVICETKLLKKSGGKSDFPQRLS